jgi:hypothetical protein
VLAAVQHDLREPYRWSCFIASRMTVSLVPLLVGALQMRREAGSGRCLSISSLQLLVDIAPTRGRFFDLNRTLT